MPPQITPPWEFMTYFVNFLIENGIPQNTLMLLLIVPLIATVVVFMRQVVGMNTFGMHTPVIICLIFLIVGINFGLITLICALTVGILTRYALKEIHLLFLPKLAIVTIMVSLTLFALLVLSIHYRFFDSQFLSMAIFPMIMLGSITEKITGIQSEAGIRKTLWLTLQTIIIAVIAYFISGGPLTLGTWHFQWSSPRDFIRHYPEAIFLLLLLNIGLGKWTGLRLVEYIRFREIFHHNEEE